MLDTLDQIRWKDFHWHVYGQHDRIPVEIRNLRSPDADVRRNARGFLLGEGQDYGDVYDTTPQIIPFLIALLADEATPDKASLLNHLAGTAEQIFNVRIPSVSMIRLYLATYDAFKNGLSNLIQLFQHDASDIRSATAKLVQYLSDDVDQLIPELLQRFHFEQDEQVQIALLNSLKTLFGSLDARRYHLYEAHTAFFKQLISGNAPQTIRVAAARVAVEFGERYHHEKLTEILPEIPALLAQEFLERICPLNESEHYRSDTHAENIVKDLARLYPTPLLDILRDPALNAQQAHLVARGLLAHTFLFGHPSHWQDSSLWRAHETGSLYARHDVKLMFPREKEALRAIVEADKVWQRPTNLFSYFYALPDSREELRALLDD